MKYLFNPFLKIAGLQAFLFGLLFLLLSLVLSYFLKGVFDGVIDFHIVESVTVFEVCKCLLIDIVSLVVVFYPLGLILNKGKVRFIDILGTFLYARFPLLILPLTNIGSFQNSIVQKLANSIQNKESIQLGVSEIVFLIAISLVLIAVLVWYIALLYKAYTVSANLKGTKAIISFIGGLIFAEILSKILIYSL